MYAKAKVYPNGKVQLFWVSAEYWPHLDRNGNFLMLAGSRTTTAHTNKKAAEQFAQLRGLRISQWRTS